LLTFYNRSFLPFCADIQAHNRPISEEADRQITLPSIRIPSSAHRVINLEISKLIAFFPENICQLSSRREFIDGSAIDTELFEAAISTIEDTGYWEPQQALGWKVSTQWKTSKPQNFGALACFLNEDGSLWQAKPQNPRLDGNGKVIKYETPVGNGSRAFLPAIPRSIRRKISQRYGVNVPEFGSFWDWVKDHPEIPIIITEGGKKSLSLLSQGYVAIALYGVDGGGLFNEWIGGEKLRKLKPELIADLQPFAVSGRQVTLAFDQDESTKTRSQVSAALDRLGGLLRVAGCTVSIAQWDGQTGRCKGVDDLIVNAGVAAWETALCGAVSFNQWSIARQLTHEVRRRPDLNIGDREFHEVADQLPKSGIVALYGGKGSGKSKAIGELVKWMKWLSITHLSSLGRDQAAGGCVAKMIGLEGSIFSRLILNGCPILV